MRVFIILYKILKRGLYKIDIFYSWVVTWFKFKLNGVSFYNSFVANGRPLVNVNLNGSFVIGANFTCNSGKYYNMIGRQQRCYFVVGPNAKLIIGNNVGISCAAIVCHKNIVIGNNVKIGGNTVIYDTNFHSLDSAKRNTVPEDIANVKTGAVIIGDNVFIGAHSIVLKGLSIGENSIVGAGSVVTKSIPAGEIWAGNPAKFIRNI
jgi:acetyltransferase-like isoleucine patch superfamily enzyme